MNGERGARNGERGARNGERGARNGERGARNGERGARNGERGAGCVPSSERTAFEIRYASDRGWCLRTAREAGYHSFSLPAENGLPAGGFGAVAVPPEDSSEAELVLLGLEARGISRADIKPFGEGVLP